MNLQTNELEGDVDNLLLKINIAYKMSLSDPSSPPVARRRRNMLPSVASFIPIPIPIPIPISISIPFPFPSPAPIQVKIRIRLRISSPPSRLLPTNLYSLTAS